MKQWLERHLQTLVGSLGRLWQKPFATLLTILVIGIALALPACLHVLVQNGKGVLAQVASAVSSAEADITHLDMDPSAGSAARAGHPAQETTELRLLISVRDRVHLADVLRTMRRSPVVLKVSRTRLH